MAVLYVDTEHDAVLTNPALAAAHQARTAEARDRIEGAAGQPCLVARFPDISVAAVARTDAAAIVIGGNTTDWARFDLATMAGLLETIRAAPVPILGICAGHQLIGLAHGAAWGPLGPIEDGEADPDPRFAPGRRKERGFQPVRIDQACPLFTGLDDPATIFQSHYWQLTQVPAGFAPRASSPWSPIQAIERQDRPVFGVQFHPERADAAHPAGTAILRNFFALARRAGER